MLRIKNDTKRTTRLAVTAAILMIAAIMIVGCARPPADEKGGSNSREPTDKSSAAKPQAAQPSATPSPEARATTGSTTDGATASNETSNTLSSASASPSKTSAPMMISNVEEKLAAYRGKVIILDVWATWCGPCRMEIPGFVRLQDKYRAKGLEIIGVSIDPITSGQGEAVVTPFMQQYGINYTIWMMNDRNGFGKYPPGQGIPTTYIIDRKGRIAKTYIGAQPEAQFENDILSLL